VKIYSLTQNAINILLIFGFLERFQEMPQADQNKIFKHNIDQYYENEVKKTIADLS
jgi:hypothetical protein